MHIKIKMRIQLDLLDNSLLSNRLFNVYAIYLILFIHSTELSSVIIKISWDTFSSDLICSYLIENIIEVGDYCCWQYLLISNQSK